jgi:cob(I)alamin adenosyltransferase
MTMPENFKKNSGSGDLGFTDLFGGRRVAKTHRRVKLNALIDDLSALLGLLKTALRGTAKTELSGVQAALVRSAGLIAGMKGNLAAETSSLEILIARRAGEVKVPKKFVLPGSNETEALAHIARAKARVCEILAWELKAKNSAVYLNRLSDYLFLVAVSLSGKK